MTQTELEAERERKAAKLAASYEKATLSFTISDHVHIGYRAGWDAAMKHFPKWTPVSERLPEEDEKVLAFFLPDIDEAYEHKICTYDADCAVWRETATDDRQDYIIAWIPLPGAYKP